MSGSVLRIGGDLPITDISTLPADAGGSTIEISNINDFDIGLLGNQRKLVSTPPRTPGGAGGSDIQEISLGGGNNGSDGIEFVNLEDTAVSYDVRPPPSNGDSIRIVRDSEPVMRLGGGIGNGGSSSFVSAPPPMSTSAPMGTTAAPTAPVSSSSSGWFSGGVAAPTAVPAPESGGFANKLKTLFGGGSTRDNATNNGSNNASGYAAPISQPVYLTPEEENAKKMEGLTLLERMDRKGIGGTKMTIANTLDEINAEVARRKDSKGLEASIRFQRSMMTTVTSGMEFLNNRYDPLGLSLDGWSEQVNENIEDFDEIFEELYDKYKDKSKVAPEVRLVMSLGLSAAMCHITNTMFKSKMPGMDDILRKNPDLARQMAQAAATQAVGPGFANFVGMGMPSGSGNRGGNMTPPTMRQPSAPQPMPSMNSIHEDDRPMFTPPMGSGIGGPIPNMDPRGGIDMNGGGHTMTARREMRGPSGVEDILRTLETAGGAAPNRAVPPPAQNIDSEDLGSVHSGMTGVTTETMRRQGLNRRRKPTTTQPTGATLTLNV
jgi:hypothetical protein